MEKKALEGLAMAGEKAKGQASCNRTGAHPRGQYGRRCSLLGRLGGNAGKQKFGQMVEFLAWYGVTEEGMDAGLAHWVEGIDGALGSRGETSRPWPLKQKAPKGAFPASISDSGA